MADNAELERQGVTALENAYTMVCQSPTVKDDHGRMVFDRLLKAMTEILGQAGCQFGIKEWWDGKDQASKDKLTKKYRDLCPADPAASNDLGQAHHEAERVESGF
jgi:hypothetical protein